MLGEMNIGSGLWALRHQGMTYIGYGRNMERSFVLSDDTLFTFVKYTMELIARERRNNDKGESQQAVVSEADTKEVVRKDSVGLSFAGGLSVGAGSGLIGGSFPSLASLGDQLLREVSVDTGRIPVESEPTEEPDPWSQFQSPNP